MNTKFDAKTKFRLKKLIKILLCLFAIAVFLLVLNFFGIRIPCLFYTITGLKCPGCGTTRMCLSLLHGNIRAAIYFNKVVPFLILGSIIIFIRQAYLYVFIGKIHYSKLESSFFILAIIALLIYGLLRNLPFTGIF